MLELPETTTIARQITDTLSGRTVTAVFNATHPHKFTWFTGDPASYPDLLTGHKIVRAEGRGAYVDILFGDDIHLALSDGVMLRLYAPGAKIPPKYQLLLAFDDESFLVFSVQMYGGIQAFRGTLDNPYYVSASTKPSPLSEAFDEPYFDSLFTATLASKPTSSAKAFLATEQRIPGLGNGVLQDILFRSRINPKRKIATLSSAERHTLFVTVRDTLREMTDLGGRDTDRDLFGSPGGYRTILSKNTLDDPCPVCGGPVVKEPYLGGAIYYCPSCQPI